MSSRFDQTNRAVIFGATSAIAHHFCRLIAQEGSEIVIVGRDLEKLKIIKDDLSARGARGVHILVSDLKITDEHPQLLLDIKEKIGEFDLALIAYGSLGDQKRCEEDFGVAHHELQVNFISVVSLLTLIANDLEIKGSGNIAVISSVAGDRGRKSNYVYGTAKGALTIFLQGLRNRLSDKGVRVLTIKPGFVDTPMTSHMKRGMLFVTPDKVAAGILKALQKGSDVVYLPFFWRYIMLIIKLIPERIFKRLSI